eukprot:m.94149 g.94149  ORF g.94149 m.94149 type:complete len:64 (-) comp14715_c1_seq11:2108-2299(-)
MQVMASMTDELQSAWILLGWLRHAQGFVVLPASTSAGPSQTSTHPGDGAQRPSAPVCGKPEWL